MDTESAVAFMFYALGIFILVFAAAFAYRFIWKNGE